MPKIFCPPQINTPANRKIKSRLKFHMYVHIFQNFLHISISSIPHNTYKIILHQLLASRHSVFALISIFNKYNCDITYLFRFFIYFALCFHYYEFEFYSFLLCVSFIEEILCVVRVFFLFST